MHFSLDYFHSIPDISLKQNFFFLFLRGIFYFFTLCKFTFEELIDVTWFTRCAFPYFRIRFVSVDFSEKRRDKLTIRNKLEIFLVMKCESFVGNSGERTAKERAWEKLRGKIDENDANERNSIDILDSCQFRMIRTKGQNRNEFR